MSIEQLVERDCERTARELAQARGRVRAWRERARVNGVCQDCGMPAQRNRVFCKGCAEDRNLAHRQSYNFYRELGLCVRCHCELAVTGGTTGERCRARRRLSRKA